MEKIWVSEEWFISVDDKGYVIGPCFEGMLGCVLQLKHGKGDAVAAMKIPRLLADTIEENAYICKLTEDEEDAVRKINTVGGRIAGLVSSQFFQTNPLIKRRSTQNSFYPEAQKQHDHVIFISFEQDKKPRFCSVDFKENKFSVFPQGCKEDFQKNVSADDWQSFIQQTQKDHQPDFSRTMFRWHDPKEREPRGELIKSLMTQHTESIWYAALPSIIFEWAQGNLQETITKGETIDWTLDRHFTLFEQVLNGVRFLHTHHMIHGDIRPANVMCIGSQLPENFRLGDYGSYGREWQAIAGKESPGGLTLVGPAIGRQRETPFYSPERRAGNEFESANVAVIKKVEANNPTQDYNYLLLLGWRSELITDRGEVNGIVNDLMDSWLQGAEGFSPAQLQKGDRLRVRNYLFEIVQAGITENDLKIYRCSGRYAEILHDRLIVYKEGDEINDWTIIDLSNYVEFHQWSAATDLYSVGALSLYCVFSCGLQRQPGGNRSLDRLFVEMIEILESVPYFKFFWEELETFRQTVETLYDKQPQPSPQEAADSPVLRRDSTGNQTLFDMALHATNNILQSTPKARIILEQFDMNVAHFLLFMHFGLACLHRQSHMPSQTEGSMGPFAKDRAEPPEENGAANRAFQRLVKIRGYLAQPFFREFRCKEGTIILDFNPRSDFQLRIEQERLRNEILDLKKLRSWPLLSLHPEISKLVGKFEQEEEQRNQGTVTPA